MQICFNVNLAYYPKISEAESDVIQAIDSYLKDKKSKSE
jgi:hypothetical protein